MRDHQEGDQDVDGYHRLKAVRNKESHYVGSSKGSKEYQPVFEVHALNSHNGIPNNYKGESLDS